MQNQNEETKQSARSTKSGKHFIFIIISLVIIILLILILLPGIPNERVISKTVICQNYLKNIALSVRLYSEDYNSSLPTHKKWNDLLEPYLPNNKGLKCPVEKTKEEKTCTYVLNSNLKKLNGQTLKDTVIAFEGPVGWNQTGGPEMMVFRHQNKCTVALADGSTIRVNETEAKKLKWKP